MGHEAHVRPSLYRGAEHGMGTVDRPKFQQDLLLLGVRAGQVEDTQVFFLGARQATGEGADGLPRPGGGLHDKM